MALAAIPSPSSRGLDIGPFTVHVYGLMYAIGVLAAVTLTSRLWERRGDSRALVHDVALWAFPAGLLGGRLYFLATSWTEVPPHWWGPLVVWKGGLSIWGGIALGTLVGLWRLRRAGADVATFMDVAAPGLLIAQAIGRVGNYFNRLLRFRIFEETLHIDPSHHVLGLRLNFFVATALFICGVLWFLWTQDRNTTTADRGRGRRVRRRSVEPTTR